jgi:UDP-glucose:(heptosyl)LPS alpha-1,3-glucosyltransferase
VTDRLRVAMVALDFHRHGGSEGRTGHLVDALVAQGHEVHLLGARIRDDWDPRVVRRIVPTARHPKWLETLVFIRGARRIVERVPFDIIHNQIRPYLPGVVTVGGGCHRYYLERILPRERGALGAWGKRISPLHRILLGLERRRYRPDGDTWVIANSRLNRDGILAYYPLPAERIRVVYNGVDPDRFTPGNAADFRAETRRALEFQDEDVAVLFVGGNFARKGLGLLLEATARSGATRARLRVAVVGGRQSSRWDRLVHALGLDGRVRFVGPVAQPERYYAAADVFALPTHFDPFANAALEAMASGLPVITTRQNGVAEILAHGVNGLIADDPPTAAGLAALLAECGSADRRRALGQAARETALGFSWAATAEATLDVYRAMRGNPPEHSMSSRSGRG